MQTTNTPPPYNSRRNKILLGIFVPLWLITFAGAGLGVGYAIWYHKHKKDTYCVVNNQTATTVIPAIYRAGKDTPSYENLRCINLKSISQQNGSTNKFKLEGEIDTPIFCPDGYMCDLIGVDNATINLAYSEFKTAGIIFGMTSPNALPNTKTGDVSWNISNIDIVGNDNSIGVYILEKISQNITIKENKILDCSAGLCFTEDVDANCDIKSNVIISNRLSSLSSYGVFFENPVYGNIDISSNKIINISSSESFNIVFGSHYNGKAEQNYNIYHNVLKSQCHNDDITKVCKAQSILFVGMSSSNLAIINVNENFITTHMDNSNVSSEQFAFNYSSHESPSALSSWSDNFFYSNTTSDPGCNSTNTEILDLYKLGFHWFPL